MPKEIALAILTTVLNVAGGFVLGRAWNRSGYKVLRKGRLTFVFITYCPSRTFNRMQKTPEFWDAVIGLYWQHYLGGTQTNRSDSDLDVMATISPVATYIIDRNQRIFFPNFMSDHQQTFKKL